MQLVDGGRLDDLSRFLGGVFQLALLEEDCPDCVLGTLQVPISCPSFKLGGVGDVLLG